MAGPLTILLCFVLLLNTIVLLFPCPHFAYILSFLILLAVGTPEFCRCDHGAICYVMICWILANKVMWLTTTNQIKRQSRQMRSRDLKPKSLNSLSDFRAPANMYLPSTNFQSPHLGSKTADSGKHQSLVPMEETWTHGPKLSF